MPRKLLQSLAGAALPIEIDDQDEIAMCCVLRNANLIEAVTPPLLHDGRGAGYAGGATVLRITDRGRATSHQRGVGSSNPVVAAPDVAAYFL